jgi:hypothetical protein
MSLADPAPTRYRQPLDEWVRWAWASPEAEAQWTAAFPAISAAWAEAERQSVGEVRRAAIQSVDPEELPAYAKAAAARGLAVLPLYRARAYPTYRAASAGDPRPGDPWVYQVALVHPAALRDWMAAWTAEGDSAIGDLLGYPPCCQAAFKRHWVQDHWIDPTWPMAVATPGARRDGWAIDLTGVPESNSLLRWLGVRLVPHLPCSFRCTGSLALGRALADLMPEPGRSLARSLLAMPMEWSAWHGIGRLRTPIGQASMRSEPTKERLIVRYHGVAWPTAGVSTGAFPYVRPVGDPAPVHVVLVGDEWRHNGFASAEAMHRAHDSVIAVARTVGAVGSALDLGCGSGVLLTRLEATRKIGVELDPTRAALARRRGIEVIEGEMVTLLATGGLPETELTLLSPIRLVERPNADALAALKARTGRVLLYAYGDVLAQAGSLEALIAQAGLGGRVGIAVRDSDVVEAALWEP